MATTKNYFTKQLELSHKDIRGKRAKLHAEDAERASEKYIRKLEDTKRKFERKLMNLEDFHVDSTTSLQVTKDKFTASEWVSEINEVQLKLVLNNQKLKIAQDIHDKYFK